MKPDQTNFTEKINKINNTQVNNTTVNQIFLSIRNNIKNQKQKKKRTRRSMNRKTAKNKLKILYSNARGLNQK